MGTMKTLNGFEIVDAQAREDIEILKKSGGGGGGSADLTNYYTKDETYSKTEIDNKGYLTEHQSLEGYATEQYVNDQIANIDISTTGISIYTFDDYSTTEEDKRMYEYIFNTLGSTYSIPKDYVFYYGNHIVTYMKKNNSILYLTVYTTSGVLATSVNGIMITVEFENGVFKSITKHDQCLRDDVNDLIDFKLGVIENGSY